MYHQLETGHAVDRSMFTVLLQAQEGLKGNKQVIGAEMEVIVAYRPDSIGVRKTMAQRGVAEIGRVRNG